MAAYPFFFFNDTATTEIYTLSLHDALPIFQARMGAPPARPNSSIWDRVGIDDFDPVPGSIRLPEPRGDLPPGRFDGGGEGSPEGEVRRGRRGEGAAGAVQGLRVPPPAKAPHPPAVIEGVDPGPVRVASFDEDRLRPAAKDGACRGLHRFDVRASAAGPPPCFESVRGRERGEAEEAVPEGIREV